MKVDTKAAAKETGLFHRGLPLYQSATGQSVTLWAAVALINLVTQAVFFHEMWGPKAEGTIRGEFGIFNSALGIIGLLTVPALALSQSFRFYLADANPADERLRELKASSILITETFVWIWSACCFVLIFLPDPLPALPRSSLQLFALLNLLLVLSGVVSATLCESAGQLRTWAILVGSAALVRLALGGILVAYHPSAEAALTAFLVAGFITLIPALRPRKVKLTERLDACVSFFDRDFLLFAGATLSVLLGVYLFANADRIVAVRWMNAQFLQNVLSAEGTQDEFDTYQATGLFARAVLWGTQPLLWILYAERCKLKRTTLASLKFFWIYLGALLAGVLLVFGLSQGWSHSWLLPIIGNYGPTFAVIMLPLGLLQGFGIFSLASRRYPECFVFGGCSIAYTLVLSFFGRRPDILLPYMFGSAVVCLTIVLFVGVVRWGRKQP